MSIEEELQDKISDYFKDHDDYNIPFFRVDSDDSVTIDGLLDIKDMESLVKIFKDHVNKV